jgi:hypothetical protein
MEKVAQGQSKPTFDPPGLRFFDQASNRWMKYFYPDSSHGYAGWICYKHPEGQWVTLRKATEDDLRRINKAVVEAHHAE